MRKVSIALVLALALGGCSGSAGSTPPTPAPIVPTLSIATQRAEAQATIAVANGIQVASLLAMLVHAIKPTPIGSDAAPACKNGVETTVVQKSPARFLITIDVFYDANCTGRLSHAVLSAGLSGPDSLRLNGTQITYDRSGNAVAYARFTNATTFAKTDRSIAQGSIALTPNGPAVLTFGLACAIGATNDCGFGGVASIASLKLAYGVTSSIHNFVASGKARNGAVALNAYQGKLGSLELQRHGMTWQIEGGSLLLGQRGSFAETADARRLDVDGSLKLQDSTNDAATSASFGTRTGIADGNVRQATTEKGYATFSTDAVGNGSIRYSNGKNANIVFFIVTR